jgi:hypothetical protein
MSKSDIREQVVNAGLRPAFPSGVPPEYAQIARDCWAADPELRPPFSDICRRLQDMIPEVEEAALPGLASGGFAFRRPGDEPGSPFVKALVLAPARRARVC